MRQSFLFTKTRREAPKDEVSKNAQLLIRAGYIHKEMAGVYSYLPLGLRVLSKIVGIIREEMNAIGGQEISMSLIQDRELYERTDRWDDSKVDNWFKSELKNGGQVGLALTNEEPLTRIMSEYIQSYKDLPKIVYQINTKFRNEARAKSGIMRGREFLMKDMYSFHDSEEDFNRVYEMIAGAYVKVFDRLGVGEHTYRTFASGGIFSKYSHEFQTVSEAGEDLIYVSKDRNLAVNKEVLTDAVLADLDLARGDLREVKAIEVGNIFTLGSRFSDALGLSCKDSEGNKKSVLMGCYGIGPSRLMGTIVELLSDEKGIVWPESVAPFQIHLLSLDQETKGEADKLYKKLIKEGKEVLYDDRDVPAGEKFADADLIGIPERFVVSKKSIAAGGIEVKDRRTGDVKMV
ncbi:MAG TPA: aminoacyl--tRNA ligase-related protein [Candidatus Paceibacterota bacterium]